VSKHHTTKSYKDCESKVPRILNLLIRCNREVSFIFRPLLPFVNERIGDRVSPYIGLGVVEREQLMLLAEKESWTLSPRK
jgi:hypothetical protein